MEATAGSSKTGAQPTPATPNPKPKGGPRGRKPKAQKRKEQLIPLLSSAKSATQAFLSHNEIHLLPSQSLSLHSILLSLPFPPSPSQSPSPSPSFFHRFISSAHSDSDPRWYEFFRMSKSTFLNLLSILTPPLLSFLPPSIPPDSAVASALFRLAHGASYEASARRFGLDSSSAACLAFYSVCKVVNESLANLVDLATDKERVIVGFGWISFPNCCGVLGFGKFGVDSEVLGKNGSLLVQALVDSEGRFLDISSGWPSAMKPSSIFSQTKLYSRIEESRELLNGPCYQLNDGNAIPQYILGDSCFPLFPWLLTPYIRPNEEDSFGSAAREFNAGHSRAMRLVTTAFGRVKARWQLLAMRWKEDCVEFFPFVIVMGCLLHNFLIKCGESMPEESVECYADEVEMPVFQGEAYEEGQRTREALAMHLSWVRMRR
ncbi:protein ANTAGONIST OF LIKE HETEROCHROMATIN PROTEIN 1 [Mercurialis annua]|uniref:protein ANTAGONIST OF LIKE HETEROCHROMATIN PROTEIN 1 n=1 Tax=Mercurialis annua TaxID=3986 RepID=UPI00215F45EB|nr:protein ANTAGONIST OF LIKE HETEROCHROMATIN PROTEIN 1 [Mercurialis annua]